MLVALFHHLYGEPGPVCIIVYVNSLAIFIWFDGEG
jgi:hypothetical protein